MKKQINVLKLTLLAGSVAAFGVGCASSGYASHDSNSMGVGASASVDTGMDADMHMSSSLNSGEEADASSTVTALSFTAPTDATQINKWPFWEWRLRSVDTYTFAVPDPTVQVSASSDLPQFSVNLPPGSVFVEAAGGSGETRAGRVIQHSPNPGLSGR